MGEGGFEIENGVLVKYQGSGGDVSIPEGVTEVADCAFDGCTSLTSLFVPASVRKIGECAFTDCSSLTSVSLSGGVREVGVGAFVGCTSLASVTIPEGVVGVGKHAFDGCPRVNLAGKAIPEGRLAQQGRRAGRS